MVSQAILYAAHVLPVGLVWVACVTGFFPLMEMGPDCDCFRHLVLYVSYPSDLFDCIGE